MNFRRYRTSGKLRATGAAMPAVAIVLVLGGCGEVTNTITPKAGTTNQVTVELAGPPSAYYVGLYAAQALGYFKQTDINVVLKTPTTGQDPLTLLHDDQVLVAISSEPSVFLARNLNEPVVAVGALVQKPLSQIPVPLPVVRHPPSGGAGITTKSTTVTTTGKTSSKHGKGKPATTTVPTATLTQTTTAPATTTTAATTTTPTTTTPTPAQVPTGSVWPAQLQSLLTQSTAPTYDALVVVVRKGTIVNHAPLIRRFVQALARGYRAVRSDPRAGVDYLIAAQPGFATQRHQLLRTVRATMNSFFPDSPVWGLQNAADWNAFGSWMAGHGLVTNPNAITDASTNELLAGEGV